MITEESPLTPQDIQVLRSLEARGFAVAVFTPAELKGVDEEEVQEAMIQAGWEQITYLMLAQV